MSGHADDAAGASIDAARVACALAASAVPALDVTVLPSCTSTNDLALGRLRAGASGFAIVAERQTAGRGRRGATWLTPAGALAFTVGWRFAGRAAGLAGLSLAVGVALCEALRALGLPGIGLKWPNDILWRDAKLAGILIETTAASASGAAAAAVGVGINLRVDDAVQAALVRPVTGLAEIAAAAGRPPPSREAVVVAAIAAVAGALQAFARDGFSAEVRVAWQALDAWRARPVRVVADGAVIAEGHAAGVDPAGALLIATAAGLRAFHAGEVSLRAS